MEVRNRAGSGGKFSEIPVVIRSVSVGGLGLSVLVENFDDLARGELIAVYLNEGRGMNMPGQVAWSRYSDPASNALELGIQLMLVGTPPWTRMRYSSWVDEIVNASRFSLRS